MNRDRTISVIVPMYNAENFLEELFDCFFKCDFQPGDEIILVDNNSSDNTYNICQRKISSNPQLFKLLTYDDKADSYAARNYGVKNAKGTILAFTDSDCKPTAEWLECVRNNLGRGEILAGEIKLEIINNGIWECFDSITHLSQSHKHIKNHCVATANMSVYKEDFFLVGFFEERFAGGDFEWSTRAYGKGLKIIFDEKALIFHPSRKTYEEILTRERRGAYGAGKHAKLNNKSLLTLLVIYILKIIKIDTYIHIANKLKEYDIPSKEIVKFYASFFKIRCAQLRSAIDGYKGTDVRIIGIK